jgi:hypothetical protein
MDIGPFTSHLSFDARQRLLAHMATMQHYAIFANKIKANQQIIDLQGDRIFTQSNG